MRLNSPTIFIFVISVLLVGLGILSRLGIAPIPEYMPHQEFWLAVIGYLLLMLGNLVRGL